MMLQINVDKLFVLQGEMSDTQFAKKLEISRQQLWRIKNNHSAIGADFVAKLKRAYPEISLDAYFYVEDVPSNQQESIEATL